MKQKIPPLSVWARVILIIVAYIILTAFLLLIGFSITDIPLDDQAFIKNITIRKATILQLFPLLATIVLVFIFRRFLDFRSIKSLGFSFKGAGFEFVLGFFVAVLIIGVGSLFLNTFGFITISNLRTNSSDIIMGFVLFIMVSLSEELLFRGYILNNLLITMNKYYALIISSILFALMHSLNFNLSLLAIINLFLAGIILGSTYIYTKNLWFPISFHLFWNFFQGSILGYSVSGQKIESLLALQISGNEIFNGGEFGFEGSIVCTVLTSIATVLLLFWQKRKAGLSAV